VHHPDELEALRARLIALERVWEREGAVPSEGTVASIRRIARSLEDAVEGYGYPEFLSGIRRLRSAPAEELGAGLDEVLEGGRRLLEALPREESLIVVVAHDPEVRSEVRGTLAAGNRTVRTVASVEEIEMDLDRAPPDLIVLELDAGGGRGREALLSLREQPSTLAVPVLVLASRTDPTFRAECLALGADEFLEKPVDQRLLAAVVSARLGRTAALTRLAQEDQLTGLPSRGALLRIFRRLKAISDREGQALALVLLDVDRLKEVNDRLGHSAGDRVLEALARGADEVLRDSDVVGRWGGDEFVVLLPNTGVEGAIEAVEKARFAFGRLIEGEELGGEVDVGFSAGVVRVRPDEDIDSAVSRADRLLYRGKSLGGGRVVGESSALELPSRTVLLVEDDDPVARVLRRFLEGEGFRVRRASDGAEALTMIREEPPDLLVLDILLPGPSGFEVLREMRGDPTLQDVPVLILSAVREEEAVVKGFRLGVDEYLSKPVKREDFLARVRGLVRNR